MFAFVDESGHTGKLLDDTSQPVFYTLGLMGRTNLDYSLREDVLALCRDLSVSELHGADLGERIEEIAPRILACLQKSETHFFLGQVDKDYLAISKLFDTIFDYYENRGARMHIYQVRPLRLLLLYKLCSITQRDVAFDFYKNCLFADSEEQAVEVLIGTCEAILRNVGSLPDQRSRVLISDALVWAKNHPKEITTYNTRKVDRWKHLPNTVTFLPLLDMLARYANREHTNVRKIIHDEQQQMVKVFREIHGLASGKARPDKLNLYDNGYFLLKNLRESNFEMKKSNDSPGLQVTDICLYLFAHRLQLSMLRPNSNTVVTYLIRKGRMFDFTLVGFRKECERILRAIMDKELSDSELEKSAKFVESMEEKWKKQVADFERTEDDS